MTDEFCWENGPWTEDGEDSTTCVLPKGHSGPHEWTRDDKITIAFPGDKDMQDLTDRKKRTAEDNPMNQALVLGSPQQAAFVNAVNKGQPYCNICGFIPYDHDAKGRPCSRCDEGKFIAYKRKVRKHVYKIASLFGGEVKVRAPAIGETTARQFAKLKERAEEAKAEAKTAEVELP